METKELGKIQAATFGFGGYQNAMMSLSLTLGGDGWGVGTFIAIERSGYCKWTE